MNDSALMHQKTVQACLQACRHSAQQCADAAGHAESAHRSLLQRCADTCAAMVEQFANGATPLAATCLDCAEVCSQCAQMCEQLEGFAACADACRNSAQLCLALGHAGATPADTPAKGNVRSSKAPRGALAQQLRPDAVLAQVIGDEPLTRGEITRKVWAYIKENRLQDPHDRRRIHADTRLQAVFDGNSRISMFEMSRHLNRHLL